MIMICVCVFSVTRICSRTQDWLACVKFHVADHTQFRVSVFYGLRDRQCRQSLLKYGACSSSDSKMGTVGTLTHADAPHRGNAPHRRPASRVRLSRFTIDSDMNFFFVGSTHAEQIRVILKTPYYSKQTLKYQHY
jgi:hypothetical protein